MYRVLLAVDGDETRAERTANAVVDLPIDTGTVQAVILNVFEEFDVSDEGARIRSEDLFDPETIPDSVTLAQHILETAGITTDTRREHGEPGELITDTADQIDADLIVMSGRKQTPIGKVLFGSVTQAVMLSSARPVLVAMA